MGLDNIPDNQETPSMNTTNTVLWGGPEDGVEITVEHGRDRWTIPPAVQPPPMHGGTMEEPKKGLYLWNFTTKRFEWKGYIA